jgi:hypothetical protein
VRRPLAAPVAVAASLVPTTDIEAWTVVNARIRDYQPSDRDPVVALPVVRYFKAL